MEGRRVARYIGEQDILDDVYESDTRVATVIFQEFVNSLNPLIVCPCCIRQDTADRHNADVWCTGDEVAEALLHLSHDRITNNYLATNDSEFVSLFAHFTPVHNI